MDIKINTKLYKDIDEYCKINKLILEDYINKLLKDAFMIDKYGNIPLVVNKKQSVANITIKNEIKKEETKIETKEIEPLNIDDKKTINNIKNIHKRRIL